MELWIMVKNCEFGDLVDLFICDRIFCGVLDNVFKERFLCIVDFILDKVFVICRVVEFIKE